MMNSQALEEIVKGNNKRALLALLEKAISPETYKQIVADVEAKGLPRQVWASPNDAKLLGAAFKAQGITLVPVIPVQMMEDGKSVLSWNDVDEIAKIGFMPLEPLTRSQTIEGYLGGHIQIAPKDEA